MGMYTAFHLGVELKKDTPKEIIEILQYMCDPNSTNEDDLIDKLPNHPFFSCDRWRVLFRMDSYYFNYKTHWNLQYDDITKSYFISVTSNLKNYDDEIAKFMDWIHPYLDAQVGEMLGYFRFEEDNKPTIMFYV